MEVIGKSFLRPQTLGRSMPKNPFRHLIQYLYNPITKTTRDYLSNRLTFQTLANEASKRRTSDSPKTTYFNERLNYAKQRYRKRQESLRRWLPFTNE